MKNMSIAELKAQAPHFVRRVESGESYVVARYKKPVAKMVPLDTSCNKSRPSFDEAVRICGDLTQSVLDVS
jgi:antitoxin (DNA-binding transcriptional repressor) of toxin-antitoxin stability system